MNTFVLISHDGTIISEIGGDIDIDSLSSDEGTYVFGSVSKGMYYFNDGEEVQIPTPSRRTDKWDWTAKSWLPNLDAAREAQREAWNVWRDRELVGGYSHNGQVYDSDDKFMTELHIILTGYGRGYLTGTSAIRTRDNVTLQMTHAQIEELLVLIGLHRQGIYSQSWAGKDALADLNSIESIMNAGPPS